MAVAGSLAAHAEGVGRSQFDELARASIEIENSGPSLTRELPADAGSPAAEYRRADAVDGPGRAGSDEDLAATSQPAVDHYGRAGDAGGPAPA